MGHVAPGEDVVDLALPLRKEARIGHTITGLQNNLFSINKLVDADYVPIFLRDSIEIYDATNTTITVSRDAVCRGYFDSRDNLWKLPLHRRNQGKERQTITTQQSPRTILFNSAAPPTEHIYNAYELRAQPALIRYYHAAAGFPTKLTWLKAIEAGHFSSWTGLTAAAVRRNFPESRETWKGHGRKVKMNLRSTKTLVEKEAADTNEFVGEVAEWDECHHAVYNLQDDLEQKMYTDQTGRFPATSYRGMQYIMVLYEPSKSNAILVEPMRNRTSGEMLAAYLKLTGRLAAAGIKPKMHVLDNECSAEFKKAIFKNGMKYQLVPPNDHRRNVAEKEIQAFKDHFIAMLCGTAVAFPMRLWCRLLRQAEDQLSMLRTSRVDSTKSAFETMHGA